MYVILEVTSEDRSRKLKKELFSFEFYNSPLQQFPLNDGEGLRPEIRAVNYTIGAEGRLGLIPASFATQLSLFSFSFLVICLYIPTRTFVSQHANRVVSDSVHRDQDKEL